MLFKKKKPVYELRLEKFWENYDACESYRLVKYEIKKGKVQKDWYHLGSGNKDWANKIAKHYGLKITTPVFKDDD